MSRILRKTTEQGTIKKVKNQLRSESKWMMRKEKTKSTKYRTYPFCQKAPPNAVPVLQNLSLPQKPAGPPAGGGLSWAQP